MPYNTSSYTNSSREEVELNTNQIIDGTDIEVTQASYSIGNNNNNNQKTDDTTTTSNNKGKERSVTGGSSWCWDKLFCKCVFPLFILISVIAGIMIAFGISPDKDNLPEPFQDFLFSRDGWEGLKAEDLPQWSTGGAGVLQLEMLNALDDKWEPYLNKSVNEWNNGDPDVIELTVTRVQPNPNCEFNRGKFIICNGDYGDTGFHGVNEVLVKNDHITASVAKMNEYYMDRASEARKQYTMCHEIGHGFGLPHSDEDFFNLNLGNCMDYTDRPWTNTAPDSQTFAILNELYGIPQMGPSDAEFAGMGDDDDGDGTVIRSEISANNLRGHTNEDEENEDEEDNDEEEENNSQDSEDEDIPEIVTRRASEAARTFESEFANPNSNKSWVQLHRNDKSAAFQIELGGGYFLQAYFLLDRP